MNRCLAMGASIRNEFLPQEFVQVVRLVLREFPVSSGAGAECVVANSASMSGRVFRGGEFLNSDLLRKVSLEWFVGEDS